MIRRIFCLLMLVILISCNNTGRDNGGRIITVSIAPFGYFIEEIAGDDFTVNVMVPAGADPHIYEPFPEQISRLRRSVAYISDGYLEFEMTWLDRFYESNRTMKKLSLGNNIDPLKAYRHHDSDHVEGIDPHYWVSPKCAMKMALSVKDLLCELNPARKLIYEQNYRIFLQKIEQLDRNAVELFSSVRHRAFMIYHPNLGYLARDYGLEEITVEFEGKEPSPSRLKELIDQSGKEGLKTIFVQREYDTRNAKAIADEIGGKIEIIDPLSGDWLKTTSDIITSVYKSLTEISN
jgi:zinc transport system substrate-binding protein